MGSNNQNAAVAAIQFALKDDDGLTFLRLWMHGEFDKTRREWPEAPEAVYIGADPLHPKTELPVVWRTYHDVPDALAEKALDAMVPGGSSVRAWFLPHESDKGKENVLVAMKCAILAVSDSTVG